MPNKNKKLLYKITLTIATCLLLVMTYCYFTAVSPINLFFEVITRIMVNEKVNILIDRYDIRNVTITSMDVSSSKGFQSVKLQLEVSSLEDAKKALALAGPMYPMLVELNTQGAQIATYQVIIKDNMGKLLLDYFFDLQLMTESWRMADELDRLVSGIFPEPAPAQPTQTPLSTP